MGARKVGLVGLWDVVAFDEVAGINFKETDGCCLLIVKSEPVIKFNF